MLDKKMLGIDIGASRTKFAYVKIGRKPKVLFFKSMNTPNGCYTDGEIIDTKLLGGAIKTFMVDNKLRPRAISMVINSSQSVIREVNIPNLDEKEINSAIEFQLSQSFPGINQTHTISSKIYEKSEDGFFGISAFCPNRILNTYGDIADQYNLRLKYLDISSNCVSKGYKVFGSNSSTYKNVIYVNMGNNTTQIDVASEGKLLLCRFVDAGGSSIDKIISSNYAVELEEAEKIKMNIHETITLNDEEFHSFVRLGTIAIEEQLKQSIDFFNYGNPEKSIDRIIMLGSACKLKGLKEHFEELFNINCEYAVSNTNNEDLDNHFAEFLPAIGAAIREY